MVNQKLVDSVASVLNAINSFGDESASKEAIVALFRTTHRTLQQSFMRVVIIPILLQLEYDYKLNRCDGRNLESGRLASRMLDGLTDDDLFLPFI